MASGFCVSMLMLSLTTVGMHAAGNVHRYGSKSLSPPALVETLPRSYRPGSYEGSLRPIASMASSKIPESFSAETSKPWGSVAGQDQKDYTRQVNSYSQPGSVSSYRSASVPAPQQQAQASIYQRRPGVIDPASQGEKRYGSSVVSSGAIKMLAPEKPLQVPSVSPGTGILKTKDIMWDGVDANRAKSPGSVARLPPQHPAFSAPAVLQTKTGMWDSINAPSAKSPGSVARPPPQHPAFSAPAVLQTKTGMWDSINAPSAKSPGSVARPPPQHPAFSAPAVLQTKTGMWDSINAPSAKSPASTVQRHRLPPSFPGVPQNKPGQLTIYTSAATAPHSTSQRHKKPSDFSAPVVHQRWSSVLAPDSSKKVAANPRSSRPVAPRFYTGLQPGHPATRQLGSQAANMHQSKDVKSDPQMKPGLRSSRPANVASLYQHGSRLPQLSYNRD